MADEVEQKNKILFPLNSPIAVETSDVFGIEAFSFFTATSLECHGQCQLTLPSGEAT